MRRSGKKSKEATNLATRRGAVHLLTASAAVVSLWTMPHSSGAGTFNWLNNATDTWSDPAAWDVGMAPPSNDPTTALVFGFTAPASIYTASDDLPTGVNNGTFTLNSLTTNTTASDSTTGNITIAPTGSNNVITFAGTSPSLSATGGGTTQITAPLAFGAGMTIVNNGSGTLTLGGLQTSLNFGPNVTITNNGTGTLQILDGVTVGSSTGTINIANNNTIYNAATGTYTANCTIGNLGEGPAGTLNITNGYVTFAGSTAGNLFGNNLILNVAAGGTFDFAGNGETMGGITGAGSVLLSAGAGATFTLPGNRTFSGVFSGTGGVAQNSAATLTLSGANTYSGTTTIEAGGTILGGGTNDLSPNSYVSIVAGLGTLNLGGVSQTIGGLGGAYSTDAPINIASGATLTIADNSATTRTFNSGLSGSGSLVFGLATGVTSGQENILGTNSYSGTTIVNSGTLRISAGGIPTGPGVTITSPGTLDLLVPASVSFTAPISGTGTLAAEGPGTLTFSSANATANLGGLTVLGGTVVLDDTSVNGGQLNSTSTPVLTMGSATLSLNGNGSGASTENFNGLALRGAANVNVTSGSGKSATLGVGAITRAAGSGGSVNFVPTSVGGGTATFATTTANAANIGAIGDYATFNGTDWATATGSGPTYTIAAYPSGSYVTTWGNANGHTNVTSSSTITSSSTYDLRFNMAAAESTTLTGTNTLNGGGILVTPNVSGHISTIKSGTGGSVGSLTVPTGVDLSLAQFNTSSNLTISAPIVNAATGTATVQTANIASASASQTLTVSDTSQIQVGMSVTAGATLPATDNGKVISVNSPTSVTISYDVASGSLNAATGASVSFTPETNVVKSGPGDVVLSSTSTFAGLLSLNQGTVTVNAITNLGMSTAPANGTGTSAILFNGGTLEATSNVTAGTGLQPWIVGPIGGTVQADTGDTFTRPGYGFYGSGPLIKTGLGTLDFGSNNSGFTGTLNITAGLLKETSSSLGSTGNVTIANGASFQINDNSITGNFSFGSQSVLSLAGDGVVNSQGASQGAFFETVQSSGPGPITTLSNEIYLAGDHARVADYDATYSNVDYLATTIFSGPVVGPGALIKDGTGTLILSNTNNSYGTGTSLGAATIISYGTIAAGANNVLPIRGALQFGESSLGNSGAFDLKSFNQTVGGITTSGSTTQTILNSGTLTAASTFTVNYLPTNTPDVFAGQIGGGSSGNNIALAIAGTGELQLASANTYTGGTTVSSGTLTGTVAGAFGTGNLAITPTGVTGTSADNAVVNSMASIASTAAVTVNAETNDGTFGTAKLNFNSTTPTIGSLAGNGSVVLANATGTALSTGGLSTSTTFSGVISDTSGLSSLTKTGTGVFTLTNTNSYAGGTTVIDGTLTGTASGAFGTGNLSIAPNGATNTVADNATVNSTGSIAPTAAVTMTNETSDGGFGVALLNFNGSAPTIGSLAGSGSVVLNNAAGTTLTTGNSSSTTFSGIISDLGTQNGSLTVAGAGTFTLANANSYGGATTINAGATLQLGNGTADGSIASTSGVTDNGSLVYDLVSAPRSPGYLVGGSGSVTLAGTQTLTFSSANSYAGGTTVTGGTLTGTVSGAFGGGNLAVTPSSVTGTAADNATVNTTGSIAPTAAVTLTNETSDGAFGIALLNFNGSAPTIGSLAGSGSVVLNNAGGTTLTTGNSSSTTFSGIISDLGTQNGSLTVTGAGTFTLANASTYGGSTTINAGATLQLGNGTADGSIASTSGVTDNGSLVYNLATGPRSPTYVVSGSGNVTVSGSQQLTVATTNTYAGSTTVNGGTLDITGSLPNSSSITVDATNAGASLILDGTNALSSTAPITAIGPNSFIPIITVNSSQALAAINSAGSITFAAGTSTSGTIDGTGSVTVSAGATLTSAHVRQTALSIGSGATVNIAAAGTTAAASNVTSLTLADTTSTLNLNNNDMIIDYNTGTSPLSTIQAELSEGYNRGAWNGAGITSAHAATSSGLYDLGYAEASAIGSTSFDGQMLNGNAVLIKYTLAGDTKLRGRVGAPDLTTLKLNYGTTSGGTWSQGDFTYDGKINAADLTKLKLNYGAPAASPSTNVVQAPSSEVAMRSASPLAITPKLSLSPAAVPAGVTLTAGDITLVVNTTTGDTMLYGYNPAVQTSIYEIDSDHSLNPNNLNGLTAQGVKDSAGQNWAVYSATSSDISESASVATTVPYTLVGDGTSAQVFDLGNIYIPGDPKDLSFFSESGTRNAAENDAPSVEYISGGTPTPEPASLGILGLCSVMMMRRRRKA